MIFVEFIEKQSFSPDVVEEEELVEFKIVQHEKVKDEAFPVVLKDRASLDSEHVVHRVEHEVVGLRLLVLLSTLVEVSLDKGTREYEVIHTVLAFRIEIILMHATCVLR